MVWHERAIPFNIKQAIQFQASAQSKHKCIFEQGMIHSHELDIINLQISSETKYEIPAKKAITVVIYFNHKLNHKTVNFVYALQFKATNKLSGSEDR